MMKQHKELVFAIRDAVREKAKEVPVFKETGNGAIRILFYPMTKAADNWLGGFGEFNRKFNPNAGSGVGYNDIPDYEYTFAISPGGSRVITGVWDGVEQMVDTYAFSTLKIAHCSRAQDEGAGLCSGLELKAENLTPDNGYGPYRGAICVEVKNGLADYCLVYVCVSGATSKEDEECAFASIDVIRDFFKEEGLTINAPTPN